jgi:hypothetical protein
MSGHAWRAGKKTLPVSALVGLVLGIFFTQTTTTFFRSQSYQNSNQLMTPIMLRVVTNLLTPREGVATLCAGCHQARYCDHDCSKRHWRHPTASHKVECKAAAAARRSDKTGASSSSAK